MHGVLGSAGRPNRQSRGSARRIGLGSRAAGSRLMYWARLQSHRVTTSMRILMRLGACWRRSVERPRAMPVSAAVPSSLSAPWTSIKGSRETH